MQKQIVYLDLFSGTGAFAKGLLSAGFEFSEHYFSEIDIHAIANYTYHFKNAIPLGKIENIGKTSLKRPDIISFGSPCQDISLAGKSKGINAKRSGLFFEAVRLIKQLQPRAFIFENVKGLFSSNTGKDFETVLKAFTDIGLYNIQWQLLNTCWFLPQHRERIYFVGLLGEESGSTVFPLHQSSFLLKGSQKAGQAIQNIASAITSTYRKGVHARGETYLKPISGKLRRLTPLECERLQGLPDNWTAKGDYDGEIKDISDTQRYNLVGNAVSVPVVKAIGKKLITQKSNLSDNHSTINSMKSENTLPEVVLNGSGSEATDQEINVPEIKLSYSLEEFNPFPLQILHSGDCARAMREIFDHNTIQLAESFVVIYLSRGNKIIGYYRHSKGGISGTVLDPRLIMAVALKCAASSLILCHNHPSGNTSPSQQDKDVTSKIKEIAKIHGIGILDHIILTRDSHYSFADEGLVGLPLEPLLNSEFNAFVATIENNLTQGIKQDNRTVGKLAASLNIADKTEIKELTELAIVNVCRRIALSNESTKEKYQKIVSVYNHQVILSHRTSQSILLQQYSTPCPIAFLMGVYCGLPDLDKTNGMAFEPSAGNGLLTIAANPANVVVNEIDPTRFRNLNTQGYKQVTGFNAVEPFPYMGYSKFKAVLTNPPFGTLDKPINYSGFKISVLDHLMSLRALDNMADDGKAAIIIGGHTGYDNLGRISQGRNRWFFNYLYRYYNVEDVIAIEGKKLYTRQGTGFPVRLILVNGRKSVPSGAAPLKTTELTHVVSSFDELYNRVMRHAETPTIKTETIMDLDELKRKAEELRKKLFNDLNGTQDTGEYTDYQKLYELYRQTKASHLDEVLFIETPTLLITYNEDAKLVAKTLNKTYLKAQGAEGEIILCVLSKILMFHYVKTFNELGLDFAVLSDGRPTDWKKLQWDALSIINSMPDPDMNGLESPYTPASQSCVVLHTEVPDSMERETQSALKRIKEEVGGSVDNYVRHRLGYATQTSLCGALSAEQTDAVAMAIYNIEARGQGTIIGDQTGIGKGRIAAAIIRYGVKKGLKPVFLTEKANLFSDIYRDLTAIGSGHLRPFIINNREAKTDIKDEDGEVIYSALSPSQQATIFESGEFPKNFDFAVATYTQFNSPEKKPTKPEYLKKIAGGCLFILDESHNASGSSNTGNFMQDIVERSAGVVFLSATFAKRPDNMPIYALKTAINEANLSRESLVWAIRKGGVALQEILSSQLVGEGQMIRRERSYEGVEVNYIQLDEYEEKDRITSDAITKILRDIIRFQDTYVNKKVSELDAKVAAEGKQASIREGTSKAGVDNLPYFSKVFQVINQMLFSIKAEAVADRAIMRLKEGKKPVIAFASTMGSFIEQMPNDKGFPVEDGDTVRLDFAEVLKKGLDGIMRYTVLDIEGTPDHKEFNLNELEPGAKYEYDRILNEINTVSTGITISPIDTIIQKLEDAGYSVAEVTGRKFSVVPDMKNGICKVSARKKMTTNDAFRKFNNNEIDVLMINQSGSTGASAHAIVTSKVPKEEVKQRVMIVLQAELDINTEVQKRGRVNRTGQIYKPIYDYVTSAIPAEKRLMMMLQKKLKSLDANTTSNQKQSTKILDVPDFLNKYGDKVVLEYLAENPQIDKLLGNPLNNEAITKEGEDEEGHYVEDAAHKVSGRVAVLSTKMQADFYSEMTERYNDYVEYLKQIGEYDLEVEALDLQAKTLESHLFIMGKGGETAFGDDSLIEKLEVNILRKPFKTAELLAKIKEALGGKTAKEIKTALLKNYEADFERRVEMDKIETVEHYNKLIENIPKERKIRKLAEDHKAFFEAIAARKTELENEKQDELKKLGDGDSFRERYMKRVLDFFTIGRQLVFAPTKDGAQSEAVLAVCLGVQIDPKKKNPYARSAVKVKVAVAGSTKYVAIPASKDRMINSLFAESSNLDELSFDDLMLKWEDTIRKKIKDRGTRYVITGNLLQAFSGQGSKLVSYTTSEGTIKKGILMPDDWEQDEEAMQKVTVPIAKALVLFQSLAPDHILIAGNLTILRKKDGFQLILPSARSKGGDIYMDEEIWPLVIGNKFELASDKMKAMLPEDNIERLLEILQNKHSLGLEVNLNQLELIEPNTTTKTSSRKKIELPPDENDEEIERVRILSLKAKALALALKLNMAA